MPRKVNPLSNKLGLVQIWDLNLSTYGKNLKSYCNITKLYELTNKYLNRYCIKHNLFLESIFISYTSQVIFINVCIFCDLNNFDYIKKQLYSTIKDWFQYPIIFTLYKKNKLGNSSMLVSNYINYLLLQNSSSPKQILQILHKIFKEEKCGNKIRYISTGLVTLKLKGFKVEFSGCYDSSRNQMAKTIKDSFGSVSLTKLKSFVFYSNSIFFTKFGSCGLKLWLFYEPL